MATQTELDVLASYSTPGLRRCELDRTAKREHLADAYKMTGERAQKVLDEMYGPEEPQCESQS